MTRALAPILTAAALTLAACNTAPTSSKGGEQATFASVTGELSSTIAFTLDDSFTAAKGAMDDMQFRTEKAEMDALKGIVEAREADGDKVTITVLRNAERVTDVVVSVGAFGDQAKARMILDKMLARLH